MWFYIVLYNFKVRFSKFIRHNYFFFFLNFFNLYIKIPTEYYQKETKEKLQKRLAQGIKIFLKKKRNKNRQYACKRYQNLSEEEKNKKQEYYRERYKNLSQDEKQKLVEYRRNYYIRLKK